MNIRVGAAIPIAVQLFDANESLFVRAIVRDDDNQIVDTVVLTHVDNGLYNDVSVTMPDTTFVTVQYMVFTDAGLTQFSSSNYGASLDTFGVERSVWDELLASHMLAGTAGRKLNETITPAGYVPPAQPIEVEVFDTQRVDIEVEDE